MSKRAKRRTAPIADFGSAGSQLISLSNTSADIFPKIKMTRDWTRESLDNLMHSRSQSNGPNFQLNVARLRNAQPKGRGSTQQSEPDNLELLDECQGCRKDWARQYLIASSNARSPPAENRARRR
jgi:hypothetical protein